MKNILTLALAMVATASMQAQFSLFAHKTGHNSDPGFSKAVETVLGDFPYNFKHITGDLVLAEGEMEQYASTITLPGSVHCVIGRYHSVLDTTASWQALMFSGESFEDAAREYQRLYRQLKGCRVKMVDGSAFYLYGDYEAPSESMDFVTSDLRVQTSDHRFKEFKVELEIRYQMPEWVVNINMVSKKKDSEMRPDWWTRADDR